jgi:signal transduction histidine kinase
MTIARADDILNGAAVADTLDTDDLRELLRTVHETSERLEGTHVALQQEVVRLRAELAEANAQLRRSQALAALGEMAAGIAHEIRNPLGSIRLYVQMLAEDVADLPSQAGLCGKITQAITGLDAIVRDVLLFAREMRVQRRAIDVSDLVAEAIEQCAGLITSSSDGCETTLEIDADEWVDVDAVLLQQAIGNLLRNAVEAMVETPAGDRERRLGVVVARRRVRCPDGRRAMRLVISVDDSGPGIPAETVDRIFNPFFTTRRTGTGLGLAIVHRIVEAHEGHLNVKRSPWGGARVEICLPRRCPGDLEAPTFVAGPAARLEPPSPVSQCAGGASS